MINGVGFGEKVMFRKKLVQHRLAKLTAWLVNGGLSRNADGQWRADR